MNIPNSLSIIRIICIPLVMIAFYAEIQNGRLIAAGIFLFASVTDWLDGYLARRWNQTSAFGAFIDPVADKLMVGAVLVMLVQAYPALWMVIPAAVIICREIFVSALREWMAGIGARASVAVGQLGKLKTATQMAAMVLLLGAGAEMVVQIGVVLLDIAAILALISMGQYLRAAWPALRSA